MIAAIYARKSTAQDGVADEAKSVTRQVEGARAFIAARGWTLNEAHVFVDDGVSGALFANRAEFQRMMRDAAAGAFEAVVFYDLDRFGRHAHQTMVALNALADLGISVWDFSTDREVDLNSFEGRVTTTLRAEFAQQYREDIRKKTREAMRYKAEQGYVTGGKVFGYDNVRIGKWQVERRINETEAAVVRDIYGRFADGEGARAVAAHLNRRRVPSPRAQQGRPSGWSASTVRAVLERPLYRGEFIYGRTAKAYGRELGKRNSKLREKGMIPRPEGRWLRREAPALRIIDPDLAGRVDARRIDRRERYLASVAKGGRVPERAHGKYLLSGGLLVCPTCGGHFEARIAPWKGHANVYICSTRFIEDLLALVDRGDADDSVRLAADRDRLRAEVDRLVGSIAAGVPAETIAPAIRQRESEIARLDVALRAPRQAPPNIDKLRAALTQRAEQWKADLRAEPKVARLLLRRLVGPITLWDASQPGTEWVQWEASVTADLLDGLVQHVASPTGSDITWKAVIAGEARRPTDGSIRTEKSIQRAF